MRRVFAGNFLDGNLLPSHRLKTNGDVAKWLTSLVLADLGGVALTRSTPEGDEKIARMMAMEVVAAIARGGKGSQHWYSDSIARALAVASLMHPELGSDEAARAVPGGRFGSAQEARCTLFCAMAVTSQNITVADNMRFALEQYRTFVAKGEFEPKVYGAKGVAVASNLRRFNLLLEVFDRDLGRLEEFLRTPFTMREVRAAGEAMGIAVGGREGIDEKVYGSVVFGPKIGGGFLQNLLGNFSPLTVDSWMTRTFGRYTGNLIRDEVASRQVEKLVAGLKADASLASYMRRFGADRNVDSILDMDNDELLSVASELWRLWEKTRKGLVADGYDNEAAGLRKAELGWPGAAEVIHKTLGSTVDQPGGPGDRRWIRKVAERALELLRANGYPDMTMAALQSTLWYPEKELFRALSRRPAARLNIGYDEALAVLARKEGVDDEDVERALRSVVRGGGGREVHGRPGREGAGSIQGDGAGTGRDSGRSQDDDPDDGNDVHGRRRTDDVIPALPSP